MGVHNEFAAAEMSFGSFVAGKGRGDFPFVGSALSVVASSATLAVTSTSTQESTVRKIRKANASACPNGK